MPAEGNQIVSHDSTRGKAIVIVTGGAPLVAEAVQSLPPDAVIIAADSGLDHARAAGLRPDLVVGDLDSVSEGALEWARREGIPIEQHPARKDSTDTELALALAIDRGATDVCVIAGNGDRLDHTIGALTALGHSSLSHCRTVEARWGRALLRSLHGPGDWQFDLDRGLTFSLLALHGECTGVFISGAEWPLTDAVIEPGSSLGVSNLTGSSTLHLSARSGVITLIFPNYFGGSL